MKITEKQGNVIMHAMGVSKGATWTAPSVRPDCHPTPEGFALEPVKPDADDMGTAHCPIPA